jgi:hypothetical protein
MTAEEDSLGRVFQFSMAADFFFVIISMAYVSDSL